MLDLEVVPERSLGNEQWEFVLGESDCKRHFSLHQVHDHLINILAYLLLNQKLRSILFLEVTLLLSFDAYPFLSVVGPNIVVLVQRKKVNPKVKVNS